MLYARLDRHGVSPCGTITLLSCIERRGKRRVRLRVLRRERWYDADGEPQIVERHIGRDGCFVLGGVRYDISRALKKVPVEEDEYACA